MFTTFFLYLCFFHQLLRHAIIYRFTMSASRYYRWPTLMRYFRLLPYLRRYFIYLRHARHCRREAASYGAYAKALSRLFTPRFIRGRADDVDGMTMKIDEESFSLCCAALTPNRPHFPSYSIYHRAKGAYRGRPRTLCFCLFQPVNERNAGLLRASRIGGRDRDTNTRPLRASRNAQGISSRACSSRPKDGNREMGSARSTHCTPLRDEIRAINRDLYSIFLASRLPI